MTNEHGVAGYWQMLSKKSLVRVLTEGKLVIAAMGKGVFANTGHYIVLRGIAENGELLVADPNSEKKSLRTFSVNLIKKEAKGGKPFLVCEPPVSHPLITDNK